MTLVRFVTKSAYERAARANSCPEWSTVSVPDEHLQHWERFAQVADQVAAYSFEVTHG